jgi:hypothetical protein
VRHCIYLACDVVALSTQLRAVADMLREFGCIVHGAWDVEAWEWWADIQRGGPR